MIALLAFIFITLPIIALIIGVKVLVVGTVVDIVQDYAKPVSMRGANNINNPEWKDWHERYPWTPAEREQPDAWRYARAAGTSTAIQLKS